jgi:hypothetical protein
VPDRPDEQRRRISATGVVGLIGIVVATAVAASRDRPVSMIALLAAVGVLLIVGVRHLLTARDQAGRHLHRGLGRTLAGVLATAVVVTVAVPALRSFAERDVLGLRDGEVHGGILAAEVVENGARYRLIATVGNDSDEPEVVSRIGIASAFDAGIACCCSPPSYFRIRSRMRVVAGQTPGEVVARVGGPDHFYRWASGHTGRGCGSGEMSLQFRSSVVLPPEATETFVIDVPKTMKVVGPPGARVSTLILGEAAPPSGYLLLGLRIDTDSKHVLRCRPVVGDPRRWSIEGGPTCAEADRIWDLN